MAKKIRVHQLAKELGMTNAECIDICNQLGVGIASHSSSMEEPQADRVRSKAKREGLIREVIEEPVKKTETKEETEKKTEKKTAAKTSTATKTPEKKITKKPAAKEAPKKEVSTKAKEAPKKEAKQVVKKEAPIKEPKVETPKPSAAKPPAPAKPPAAKPSAPAKPPAAKPSAPAKPSAAKPSAPAKPSAAKPSAPAKPSATKPPAPAKPPTPAPSAPAKPPTPAAPAPAKPRVPLSRSGKPIPPPPRAQPKVGMTRAPRRPSPRIRPDVVLPTSGRINSLSNKPNKDEKSTGQRQQPPYQPRRRRVGRRRRRAPLEELQPVGKPEYTSPGSPVPVGVILVERSITPADLAPKLNRTVADIIKYFFEHDESITATVPLTDEFIELYASEVGAEVSIVDPGEEEEVELRKLLLISAIPEKDLVTRNPIVTVMGHVDHGKTHLLDTIRGTNVLSGEKGGITQHIGAYRVAHNGSAITFIDTPGHEAFTAMRSRGANVTDIVVLVVAADDGIMPQTVEAISHAKAAGTSIVVAVNKMDLETKNVSRVLQQLAEQDLIPESYGGDIQVVEVSAKEKTGIEDLLERISILAELEELKTTFDGRASGVVLESQVKPGQGPVATFLVSRGKLSVGDPIVAGSAWGRVRAILNEEGEKIKEAYPSMPVQVLGLSHVPKAGSDFVCAPSESVASKVAEKREVIERGAGLSRSAAISSTGANLEDIFSNIQSGQVASLNLIIKADTFGSLEAVCDRLMVLKLENLKITYVNRGVGGITENDIQLALTSNATIIGFNIRPGKKIRDAAQEEGVEIRTYEIIYKLVEDVEDALKGLLTPEYEEIVTGEAEVREVFHIKGLGYVAGCVVQSGKITRGAGVRFLRNGAIIWKGELKSLKRFTDDAKEVVAGNECGIGLSDFQDLKPNDIIETYETREIEVKL